MNKFFYWKLAVTNLKKNGKTIVPYLLTCIMTTAMFYIITSLSKNTGLGYNTKMVLSFGSYIIGIFAVIFLFYTNSFLMKQRKREFGLFHILGLEKKHLAKIIAYETFVIGISSLIIGLVFGIMLDKVMFLILMKLFEKDIPLGFYISVKSLLISCLLFGVIHFLVFLNSIRQIYFVNPIDLLHGGSYGEREPKNKWILTILGIVSLGIGYTISLTTKDVLAALALFFLAVIFVIIGTYLIFTSGSITLLKALKSNKNYYYKTNHFISISSMMYRMKKNAIGLANICILSTMVLVTLSTTISLWMGIDTIINDSYSKEMSLSSGISLESKDYEKEKKELNDGIQNILDQIGIHKKNDLEYIKLDFWGVQKGESFELRLTEDDLVDEEDACMVRFVSLADYNEIMGTDERLRENEVMIYTNQNGMDNDSIKIFDESYGILKRVKNIPYPTRYNEAIPFYLVVVSNDEKIMDFAKEETAADKSLDIYMNFDTDGTKKENLELYEKLWEDLWNNRSEHSLSTESKAAAWENTTDSLAGILFVGIFLSVLFIMAAVLIMYYKQITEGYEDKKRFEIMQKVGIGQREVKSSIRSQVLTVFFLPLVVAGIHITFAFPIMTKILNMFYLNYRYLFIGCTIGCFIVFTVIYSIVYLLTAKTYYSIVK